MALGDPHGIGPELCLQTIADPRVLDACQPVVFGDWTVLEQVAARCRLPRATRRYSMESIDRDGESGVVHLPGLDDIRLQPGTISAAAGLAAYRYVEASIQAALSGHVDGVATGPLHKAALHAAGLPYPGHTEIFAEQTGCRKSCMMLTSDEITCSLVTTHVGLAEVPALLNTERILEVIELSHDAMKALRGRTPRLIVCGLNPHAGEQGLFGGREEERIIEPAVLAARRLGIDVDGPWPADTAFLPPRRQETDGYICMYHDQGLIPLKALAFDKAVNMTLGLPIIRTSVDHGTAFDIAWQGKADSGSMVQAVRLAAHLARHQVGSIP